MKIAEKVLKVLEVKMSVGDIIKQIKDSVEDYESQGGKVTKKFILDSLKNYGSDLKPEDKKHILQQWGF